DETRFNRNNLEEVKRHMQQSLGIDQDSKVIMHSSNFRKIKNIQTIVEAFNIIQQSVKSDLVLAGDGPEIAPVRDLIYELGIEDKVHLVGQQTDEIGRASCRERL